LPRGFYFSEKNAMADETRVLRAVGKLWRKINQHHMANSIFLNSSFSEWMIRDFNYIEFIGATIKDVAKRLFRIDGPLNDIVIIENVLWGMTQRTIYRRPIVWSREHSAWVENVSAPKQDFKCARLEQFTDSPRGMSVKILFSIVLEAEGRGAE
jgi:hypothetical protein